MTEEEKKAREEEAIARASKKRCPECGRELPLTEFSRARGGRYTHLCKTCIGKRRQGSKAKTEHAKPTEKAFSEKDTDILLLEIRQIVEVLSHRGIVVEGTITRKVAEKL